jgi:hypothetical protein
MTRGALFGRRGVGAFAFLALVLTAILFALPTPLAKAGSPCGDTYTLSSGTGDWSVATNWSTGSLPTTSQIACWASNVTMTVTTGTYTVPAIQGGALQVSGGTLTIATSSDNSSITNLSVSSGALNGASPLAVSGAFSYTGGGLGTGSAVAITQSGGGAFTVSGSSQAYFYSGSIQTSSNVSITNTDLISANAAQLTTTGTVTFGPGSYSPNGGVNLTIAAKAFVTTGTTVVPDYGLTLNPGATSSLGGDLSVPVLTVVSGATLTVPSGVTLTTTGGSTINGTITGSGTYAAAGYTTTVGSGAALTVNNVAVSTGTLNIAAGATYTAGSGTGQGTTLSGGALNFDNAATTGDLTISGGDLGGTGSLAVSGAVSLSTGQILNTIAITQTGGHSFSVTGSSQFYFYGGSIQTSSNVSIANTSLIAANSVTLTTTGTVTFTPGSYNPNGGIGLTIAAKGFVTTGTTVLQNYGLTLNPGGTSSLGGNLTTPELTVASGATLPVPATVTLTTTGGSTINGTITGGGTYSAAGGSTQAGSGAALTVTNVNVSSGTLTVAAGATYAVGSGTGQGTTLAGPGGTLDLNNTGGTTGDLTINGGTLGGSGSLGVSGAVSLTSGATANSIAVTQTGGHSFSAPGTLGFYFYGGSFQTSSNVSISDHGFIGANSPSLTTTGTLTFAPGSYQANGSADVGITAAGFIIGAGSTLLPNYTLTQSGGTTTVTAGETLASGGTFTLTGGNLQVDGSLGTVSAPSGATVSGGMLYGSGTINGSVDNTGGTVSPGDGSIGILAVGGYIQGSGGVLQIADDGPGVAGTNFSQLNVSGDPVSLAGNLQIVPSGIYASAAAVGDTIPVINGASSVSGSFALVGSSLGLQAGETFTSVTHSTHVDAVVGSPQAPGNTSPPILTGTPIQGQQLSVTAGTWSNGPTTSTYQWVDCTTAAATSCTPISGATGSSYTLQASDVGEYVTVTVTAHNASSSTASSQPTPLGPVTSSTPVTTPPSVPTEQSPPTVSGTPLPGHTLTCDPGTWTGNPTFTFGWNRGSTPIAGASAHTYVVTVLDEGQTITCTVRASDAAGSASATSGTAIVAQIGTLTCPKPIGSLTATHVGPLSLGETQAKARVALRRYRVTHFGFDYFCQYGGWGERGAYKDHRFVLLLTGNPYYKLNGASVGLPIKDVKGLKLGKEIVIGLNDWYVAQGAKSNWVFKVRDGIIGEMGITEKAQTRTAAAQRKFLSSFKAI